MRQQSREWKVNSFFIGLNFAKDVTLCLDTLIKVSVSCEQTVLKFVLIPSYLKS